MSWRLSILALLVAFALKPAHAAERLTIGEGALGNIYVAGERVTIPVHAGTAPLRWSVHDFFGAEIATGTARPANGSTTIEPGIPTLGYFTLEVSAEGAQAGEPARAALAIVPPPASSGTSPFGVMTHFAKGWSTDIIPLIEKAGIRHVRDEQPWRMVERKPGQYAFPPRLANFMAELGAHHLDPLVVLAFSNPLYDGDKTPFSDAGRQAYAAYAREVAQHYASNVSAVEIWNEYNGSFCAGPCRSDRPAYYTSMLQDAYKGLKAANPSLTVLGGAAVPIPLDYFRQLFEKGALSAMDVAVIHPYRKQPEGVEEQIELLRQAMARYGTPKPIWATEFADLPDMKKSRDDVARYLVRMSTLLRAANVGRLYWYLLRDYQEFSGLGLVRDGKDPLGHYAPTPAYAAYATLIHQLGDAHFVRREPTDRRLRVYVFSSNSQEIRVVWSTDPGPAYEFASAVPVRRISMMGDEKLLAPEAGRINVTPDRNPIYLVGNAK
ncbi:MAG TPA: glycosyl hydrolase [Micropepsaceae bacterium]|nr:glycosyl hydrolase [Micropepsaceae bacterium]